VTPDQADDALTIIAALLMFIGLIIALHSVWGRKGTNA